MAGRQKEEQMPLILILRPLPSHWEHSGIFAKFRFLKPWESTSPRHLFFAAHAHSIRVLLISGLIRVDADTISQLPHLGCVATTSVGVSHIDLAACKQRGITVVNAGTVFSDDAADMAVCLLVDVLRRISASNRYIKQGLWPIRGEYPLGSKLGGKHVGIVGLGSIGSAVAKRLDPFGCIISYYSRTKKPSVPYPYISSVIELASRSDVIILTCALTEETFHIINKDVMSALGKNGVIINVGRGALIDEKELVRCLVEGDLGGAGLDVFENEPAVPAEMNSMDNVVLSPHVAVWTSESVSALHNLIVANLEAFFSSKPLLSPVEE